MVHFLPLTCNFGFKKSLPLTLPFAIQAKSTNLLDIYVLTYVSKLFYYNFDSIKKHLGVNLIKTFTMRLKKKIITINIKTKQTNSFLMCSIYKQDSTELIEPKL